VDLTYPAIALAAVVFGSGVLLSPITALRHRRVLCARAPGSARARLSSATRVTVTAIGCLIVLGGFAGVGLQAGLDWGAWEGEPPPPTHDVALGWASTTFPAVLVVAALLAARAARRFRATFWLALLTPVLPVTLWLIGYAVSRHYR